MKVRHGPLLFVSLACVASSAQLDLKSPKVPPGFTIGVFARVPDARMMPDHARARVWGRPVDIAFSPDGAMYISDDKAGAVYRVTYR